MPDKGGFPHYMLKEIFDQPQGLRDTITPRVSLEDTVVRLDEVRISTDELRALRRINIVASGTSRHAGMAGQYMIQDLVNIPVDVDYASEFEYRNPLIGPGELTIVITQSGETADTTAAQRKPKPKARAPSLSRMSSTPPSPVRRMGCFTPTPDRKSALPPPRLLPRKWRCSTCSRSIWAGAWQVFQGATTAIHS